MYELVLKWIFWFSFAIGAYVYFIYPLLLALIARLAGPWYRIRPEKTDDELPSVTLLIACFNEEAVIEGKLINSLQLEYPRDRFRILVLSDGSKDGTSDVVNKFISANPDAPVNFLDFTENAGKSATLVKGVEWLKGNYPDLEIIAFTDANAMWATDALRKIVGPFSDPKIGSVSGLLTYYDPDNAAAGRMEGLYWKYETFLKRQASRLGALPGANGSIFAMRIEAYKPLTDNRGDDFELPVMAMIDGYKSILIEEAESREAPSTDFQSEYRRKVRITGQMIPSAFMLHWKALARGRLLLAFELFSHKILRYIIPFFQIILLFSNILLARYGILYIVLLAIHIAFYLLAGLGFMMERTGKHSPKIYQVPLYFTMVNIASLVSIIRCTTGQKVNWERNR
jgi:biofilm PGA synthesis N-glycosyltransferase PgaC